MKNDSETTDTLLSTDIRNLIVMDTQFGLRGTTELKLADIHRLEARGWIAEGHENAEYDISVEGRAVIERALAGRAEAVAWAHADGRVISDREKQKMLADAEGPFAPIAARFEIPLYTHPPASVPEYDRSLIADMLYDLSKGGEKYTYDSIRKQMELLIDADNDDAAKVRTVSRASVPEVTDAMVERAKEGYRKGDGEWVLSMGERLPGRHTHAMRSALTAALQEQRHD